MRSLALCWHCYPEPRWWGKRSLWYGSCELFGGPRQWLVSYYYA